MEGYDASSILQNFEYMNNDDLLETYQKQYSEYTRISALLRKNVKLRLNNSAVETSTMYKVDFKKTQFEMSKPLYMGLEKIQTDTEIQLKILMREYEYEKLSVIQGGNSSRFIELTDAINGLHAIVDAVTHINTTLEKRHKNRYQKEHTNYVKMEAELMDMYIDLTSNNYNDIEMGIRMDTYFVQKEKLDELMKSDDFANIQRSLVRGEDSVSFIVPSEYTLMMMNDISNVSPVKEKTPVKEKSPSVEILEKKIKKKIKKKVEEIKDPTVASKLVNDDVVLTKWLFKNKEECTDKKYSKPYYMSKEAILKMIEDDPILKKRFGPKFKKLSKQAMCDVIFE